MSRNGSDAATLRVLKLPPPHPKQNEIAEHKKRFNFIRCGRRFGKSSLIVYLILPALKGKKIGIFSATYGDLYKIWNAVLLVFAPYIAKKDETVKYIRLESGGEIDFWSMHRPDLGRGNAYHRAIIDEFAIANKPELSWRDTIRPTLTDYEGDAWFFSTPQGRANYFYLLEDSMKGQPDWSFFHFTSYDNPHLPIGEVEAAKRQLDDLSFRQEYLAEYVDLNDKPFLYTYSSDKHFRGSYEPNPMLELWISFDFNVNPMSCIVAQQLDLMTVVVFDVIQLHNSGTKELCDHILAKYTGFSYLVTGDASGSSRTTTAGASVTDWRIIVQTLMISKLQKKVRKANLGLNESQTLCNSVIQNTDIQITENCHALDYDLSHAMLDENGKLAKEMSTTGLHLFDCFRYLIDGIYPDFIKNFRKYQGWK